MFEQKLFRVGKDDDRGIGIFARASYSPPDRNLIDLYADAGVELVGLADRRPHDKFGVAAAYAQSRRGRRRWIAISGLFTGRAWPLRSSETLLTAVYQYEVQAGLTLQPNVQYIRHPGGGATDPLSPARGQHLKDATVVGLRTIVKF